KSIKSELLPTLNAYGFYSGAGTAGPPNPNCSLGSECVSNLPLGFGGMLDNTFNYSSPEYQVGMTLSINLRNRVAKADQFRAALEYRQRQITFEEQKKSIRFDVRNSQEQKLGAASSYDTLVAQHNLATAESALVAAQTAYEKAKVDIDRATGETLERMGVSIDDAKSGVVTHAP